MKLTKKLEKEARQVYDTYWESYFGGEEKKFAATLDSKFQMIGTSEKEICNNKDEALKWFSKSAKEVVGNAKFKNRKIQISAVNDLLLIHERSDIYIFIDTEWKFYSKIRLTTFLAETKKGWKVIQQHGSLPDSKVQAGETIAFEQVKRENLQLHDAVKRRTAELEQKNRDLEIESSLERVRTIAMAMKEPADMLEVCKTVSLQLQSLGVKGIRNVQTAIFYEDKGVYMNYEYYAKHDKTIITETSYTNHEMHRDFAAQMLKGNGEFFSTHIKGKKKIKDWITYQKTTNVFIDTFLETSKSLSYYWYSLGPVALGISTYDPLTDEEISLFKRFLKVFELAYRRYLDIEHAEAQAREVQIELALERVRARTMAMQNSDELREVVATLYEQLQTLDFKYGACTITIMDAASGDMDWWMAGFGKDKYPESYHVKYFDHPCYIAKLSNWKNGEKFAAIELSGQEKKLYDKVFFTQTDFKKLPEESIAIMTQLTSNIFSMAYMKYGALTWGPGPLSEEYAIILQRFAKVFEQTYTRFLDLQKAEAQTRESQIQLALERVRARTMAMHQSDQLAGVISVLCKEILNLGIHPEDMETCYISTFDESGPVGEIYLSMSNGDLIPHSFRIAYDTDYYFKQLFAEWKKGDSFFSFHAEGDELKKHFDFLYANTPESIIAMRSTDHSTLPLETFTHALYFSQGYLAIVTRKPVPEYHEIFKQFGRTLQQAYTRFLDLQKAEMQAREAQIELALERVRARTMSMQKSDELKDVAHELRVQLAALGTNELETCAINLYEEYDDSMEAWAAVRPPDSPEDIVEFHFLLPKKGICIIEDMIGAYFSGVEEFLFELEGEKGVQWMNSMAEFVPGMFAAAAATPDFKITGVVQAWFSCHYFPGGGLIMITMKPPLEESRLLMKRCAQVFGLAYRRFADLKKAETQTREAQIELGLEKVRARAMAMQKSEELSVLIATVYSELVKLEVVFNRCFIMIFDKTGGVTWWMASHEAPEIQKGFYVKYHEHTPHLAYLEGWKNRAEKWEHIFEGDVKKSWDDFLFSETELVSLPDFVIEGMRSVQKVNLSASFNNFGCLTTGSIEPLTNEAFDILLRFAKVFDLTYTRFNDLQKAEAQSREAQIELGLERVRARAMAMQKSDELAELVHTVFKELTKLHVSLHRCLIMIYDPKTNGSTWWMSHSEEASLPIGSFVKYHEYPPYLAYLSAWKDRTLKWKYLLEGNEKKEWDDFVFRETELSLLPQFIIDGMKGFGHVFLNGSFNNFGSLTLATLEPMPDEHFDILLRFAKVFDLTYTRFNDLLKAEAQAREAQIEAALEKIRSRSLAMHNSGELEDVIAVMFEKLKELDVPLGTIAIQLFDQQTMNSYFWVGNDRHEIPPMVYLPYDEKLMSEDGCLKDSWQARIAGESIINKEYSFEQKNTYFKYVFDNNDETVVPAEVREFLLQAKRHIICLLIEKNSALFADSWDGPSYSEEQLNVLRRTAKVFEQAYVRFLDLKTAEAQAREAQIEAALERVRSKAMAMRNSKDLNALISHLFYECTRLDLVLDRCLVMIVNPLTLATTWILSNPETPEEPSNHLVQYHEHLPYLAYLEAWKKRAEKWHYILEGEEKKKWDQFLFYKTELTQLPDPAKEGMQSISSIRLNCSFSNFGSITLSSYQSLNESQSDILIRFTKVFDLTYTRFNDLKQAEAQAREAKIEAALERVRSVAMSMMKSEDLSAICKAVFTQLQALGFSDLRAAQIYIRNDEEKKFTNYDYSDATGADRVEVGYDSHPNTKRIFDVIRNAGDGLVDNVISKQELDEWKSYLYDTLGQPPEEALDAANELHYYLYSFGTGAFGISNFKTIGEEDLQILKRFRNVFSLSYQRYSDISLAEAQTREAQIELSLERVRAKTMAMHNSNDVGDTVSSLFDELKRLGIETIRCGIGIMNDKKEMEVWTAKANEGGSTNLVIGYLDMNIHPLLQGAYNGWQNKSESFSYELNGDDLIRYYTAINSHEKYPVQYDIAALPATIFHNDFYFTEGTLFSFSIASIPDEYRKIVKRFAGVFGQTYRRYLDLQKAEAQAREAQIEAALERVRAVAMSMMKSEDLPAICKATFDQLRVLGFTDLRAAQIYIRNDEQEKFMNYNYADDAGASIVEIEYNSHPGTRKVYDIIRNAGDGLIHNVFEKEDMDKLKSYLYNTLGQQPEKGLETADELHYYLYSFGIGAFGICNFKRIGGEELEILRRFRNVFSLSYQRYSDIALAEAQTRLAQIETAMEKVRARALAMQKPEELTEVARVLRKEMGLLGVEELEGSIIFIHTENTDKAECWFAIKDESQPEKEMFADYIHLGLNDTWTGKEMLRFFNSDKKQISIPMIGMHRKEWIEYCYKSSPLFDGFYGDHIPDRIYHLYKFSNGAIGAAAPGDISVESWELLQRATTVFSLAYTRFSDLQKSEAQAKLAIQRASLDRVRAETASMRTTNDLDKITPLIWNELTTLGVPFIRCGVFIMDDSQELIHTFLSTPDGKAIAAFHIPFTTPGNIGDVLNHWRQKENYIDHWNEEDFTTFAETLVKQGSLTSTAQYLQTIPQGGFHLHFLPFLQGMLYVGNTTMLDKDHLALIQSVADAFSTAYARYEDFNKLEAAKQTVEKTLVDLKQTQTQLIQSEKMASLGELTAGIAHEIQNPLNFVNNFSEVSNELIEEMKGELATGNLQLATEIANDIRLNLEKINHHGKRADAIVKGMLQHSRAGSSQKELTDINALADEYLRLAYHGLRGKDKSFNATMKTEFDKEIGKINIIPQDIGRALLNLYNNAFYAVASPPSPEKIGTGAGGISDSDKKYEPTVWLSTKKVGNNVLISVKDNGPGIPSNIIDKIFQPFFTTKPTGQGTGLGLSLSYDIITKGHGGELSVLSREKIESLSAEAGAQAGNEREGSTFTILLPLQ